MLQATRGYLTRSFLLAVLMAFSMALLPAMALAEEAGEPEEPALAGELAESEEPAVPEEPTAPEEPALLLPQETVYTVIIDPGDGGGEPLVFRSDEGEIAASFNEAQVNQFYRESDGSMGFRIDAGSCPESFTAPHGHLFNGFVPSPI